MDTTQEIEELQRDEEYYQKQKEREQGRTQRAALNLLGEIGGKLRAEEDIVFQGTKIILPANSTLKSAINDLTRHMKAEEEEMDFSRQYNYRPWDGAHAVMAALKRTFGMVTQRETMGFFGPNPPQLITINTGPNQREQVPWGALEIPALSGVTFFLSGFNHPEYGTLFSVTASGPRKYRFQVEGVFTLIEEELRTNSIYRGKAFDGQEMPTFLDVSSVDPDKVIYSQEVLTQLEANVWSLIKYSDQMRDLKLPLKRAVLFEGPYGTGKTLGAMLTAKCAVENGWTFIYNRAGVDDLATTMNTARLYQPSVVFFEDVDTVTNGEQAVTRLLDIMDGIASKDPEIICVFTTNHKDKIHKGMMRPGRLDAVIHIGQLDTPGIEKLARTTVPPDQLDTNVDWDAVGESMKDFMPAFCKEAITRTLRYSMARNDGKIVTVTTEDFVAAANGLRPQLDLMEGAHEGSVRPSIETTISEIVREQVVGKRLVRNGGTVGVIEETDVPDAIVASNM